MALLATLPPTLVLAAFSSPIVISESGKKAVAAQVAVDRDGDALIVWQQKDGSNYRIKARSRSEAGVFGPIQTLSAAGVEATNAQVAIDYDGDALIAWRRPVSGGSYHVQARSRSKAGVLGPIRTLAVGYLQDIGIDADGDALVVWRASIDSEFRIQARAHSKDGVLGPVLTLSAAGAHAFNARVAVEPRGAALFVWEVPLGPYDRNIAARFRSRTGVLRGIETVASGDVNHSPELAVDADGDALIVWGKFYEWDEWQSYIFSRARSRTGAYGPLQRVAVNDDVFDHQVAMDADGDSVVVWTSFDGSSGASDRIQARARTKAGAYGQTATLSAAGRDAFDPQVSINAYGDGLVVWKRTDGNAFRVSGRLRSRTGSFGPGQTFSAAGVIENPQVAVDADGSAVVVWERGSRATQIEATTGP